VDKKDYEDFVLRIRKDRARYVATPTSRAEVGPGPGEPFASPFREGDLDELRTFRGSGSRDLDPPKKTAQSRASELGQRLFETVFAGKIRRFWETSLDRAHLRGHGLRLRLILESPELWDWPWEYLREPDEDYLILSRDVSIVRCPEVHRVIPTLPIKLPLRVVVVIAQPRSSANLDSEREWQALKNALAGLEKSGSVKLHRVDSATRSALRKELAQPVHVLHFIGHGGFDRSRDEAYLQFETREGESDPVTGIDLARILRRQSPPALVVLNACEGGRAVKADPFAGVAQALVMEGMPAVLAMQFKVSDESALSFSKAFYEALAPGVTVDHALFEARNALVSERSVDWGNPVLYLRSAERIFDPSLAGSAFVGRRLVAAAGALLLVALSAGSYFLSRSRLSSPNSSDLDLTHFVGPPRQSIGTSEGCPPIQELGIVFKRIEPGTFIMGGHGERMTDAKPHQVTITRPFCMGETEITILQWWRVLREQPSKFKKWWEQPVESVSWIRIQDFLQALESWAPKATFRLPTEAQWEYAARAKTETRYSFGNDPAELPKYGNCDKSDDHFDVPSPVGTFAPNNWGLFDMQGNVSEWVEDWYEPYGLSPQTDPSGPKFGTGRVRRGGSFRILSKNCDVARRNKMKPDKAKDDVGFRIIRDVEP
jgi:CHAT domain-containing protein/sulfatase-modifying factor enzyme 1